MFGCSQLPSGSSNQVPTSNDLAAASLAAVFVDLLLQKECYLRALRALLREIVRALRYDTSLNLHTFCYHLMNLDPKVETQVSKIYGNIIVSISNYYLNRISVMFSTCVINKSNCDYLNYLFRFVNSSFAKDFCLQWLI